MNTSRWNGLLDMFLEELHEQFPRIDAILKFRTTLAAAKIFDEMTPCRTFVDALEPHVALLRERNPCIFERIGTIGGVDFAALWNSTADEHTKSVIFDYICALYTGGYGMIYSA